MIATLAQLFRRENGATAIEYSLVIALMAFGAIGRYNSLGPV
jgi:Flp pilus assembly pilin Flp